MSVNKKIVENNFVSMKRIKGQNGEMIYTIGHGMVTMQLNKEKAEFICKMLADWLELDVEKKGMITMLKNKANINSTKLKPLGN